MNHTSFKSSIKLITLDKKRLNDAELAIAFRCSWRQLQRYKSGKTEIDRDVSDRLAYILRAGLLPEVAKAIRERRAKDGRRKQSKERQN